LHKNGTCPIILSVTVAAETKPKPISFGSHPKGNVPLHGEPNLMGFSISGDRTSRVVVSLHGLPEREHWSRFHLPTNHAAC